ncbi:hypothetical protein C4A55_01767 [Escherichia coli]|nr:hypothetical protein C4A55_01767 [Escherichia coli]
MYIRDEKIGTACSVNWSYHSYAEVVRSIGLLFRCETGCLSNSRTFGGPADASTGSMRFATIYPASLVGSMTCAMMSCETCFLITPSGSPHRKPAGAGSSKRTKLPQAPVHGTATGMVREASVRHRVPAKTNQLPVNQNAGAVLLRLQAGY